MGTHLPAPSPDLPELARRIQAGFVVESREDMDAGYHRALRETLIVSGDTEFVSAATLWTVLDRAPSLNSQQSLLAVIQDELGHAHIAYRLLADLGEDMEALVYGRAPEQFKHPYAFDFAVDSWEEMAVVNALFDRAGFTLLGDIHRHSSYGPWRRALAKVAREETFHIRHGETWVRRMAVDAGTRATLQRAVDWMFLAGLEFFGLPDGMKHRQLQLEYRIKGRSNDELRQQWLASAVPFLRECGLAVPAHHDAAQAAWVLDVPFPCAYDPEAKRYDVTRPVGWDDVLARWKRRGPHCHEFVERLQRGRALRAVAA
jgi:ring-1,2-phenylacetyl-CoA epoxidase subunit PaaA